jgi:hypothetical protein
MAAGGGAAVYDVDHEVFVHLDRFKTRQNLVINMISDVDGAGMAGWLVTPRVRGLIRTPWRQEHFTLPVPLTVSPGQLLYLTVVGIGDFTAYDNRSDCFIGTVEGI